MPQRSLLIIGAGIAGLSAGCYGQMNGYTTRIFEMGDRPGGLCTSWTRDGYTFNGCIQWLLGTAPGGSFNNIWRELGALRGRVIVNQDEYLCYEDADGETFHWYADLGRLEHHMKNVGPDDTKTIAEYIHALRHFARADWSLDAVPESSGPLDRLVLAAHFVPVLPDFGKYRKMTAAQFGSHFHSPLLRAAFTSLGEIPMLVLLMRGAFALTRNAGYPIGGSAPFAEAIAQRYHDLGGEIQYGAWVVKVLVENDRAVGVRLADGAEYRADVVISAADGHTTIFALLDGKYLDAEIRHYYTDLPRFPAVIQVSLGVARDLSYEPSIGNFPLPEPITIAGEPRTRMAYIQYNFDPTAAPAGKSAIIVTFTSDYAYWTALAANHARYVAEKERIARQVIAALEPRFPGITDQVEVTDVATPLTYERETGNWQGSQEGWAITTDTLGMVVGTKGMRKTLPGLDHFFMVGQWVEPGGGLPIAALSGRHVIQRLCHEDHHAFHAFAPEQQPTHVAVGGT